MYIGVIISLFLLDKKLNAMKFQCVVDAFLTRNTKWKGSYVYRHLSVM